MPGWRSRARATAKKLAYRLQNRHLYRLANFYVNAVDNDHDCDFHTNGEAAFARTWLPRCQVAFDVGAAIGAWTAIALDINPALEVHCFEPSKRFDTLASRGFGSRVVLNRVGVGERPGESTIYYNTMGGSNSLFPTVDASESDTISITTLDRYCEERGISHVDFVKMDIEGYEMAALRGAERLLRTGSLGVVQFEYSAVFIDAGASLRQLMEHVRGLNADYAFYKLFPDRARHVAAYNHAHENFKTQNWAFVHRDYRRDS